MAYNDKNSIFSETVDAEIKTVYALYRESGRG